MGDNVKKLFIFVTGVAIGSAATYGLLKKKFEDIANDEISEIREFYRGRKYASDGVAVEEEKVEKTESEEKIDSKDVVDYNKIAEKYSNDESEKEELPERPYVITPDEFGEFDDYEALYFTYTSDDHLLDDGDEHVDNPDEIIGSENLAQIGLYENNVLHVRNDVKKIDYEILRVLDTYEEDE